MRQINEIIVHCTATAKDWMENASLQQKIGEIRNWHIGRGWRDIGYHFVIDRDGQVAVGRPIGDVGACVKNHNRNSVCIALVGGFGSGADDLFGQHFTDAQDDALRDLIDQLKADNPTLAKVVGHNRYAAKACPGFRVIPWLNGTAKAKKERTAAVQSRTVQGSGLQVLSGAGMTAASFSPAFSGLSDGVQYAIIGAGVLIVLTGIWIMRDRIRKFADGVR